MKRIPLVFFILIGVTSNSSAQATDDAGLWCTFNVEKNLTQKFALFLTEEYRVRENFSQNNLFYTDLGLSYKPADFIKISLSYRCVEKFVEDNTISFRHRGMLDIALKKKFGNFAVSYRQRIQAEVRNVYSSDIGNLPEWYSRNKFQIKYDLDKPITPYIATELRYQINNPRSVESDKMWHRCRGFVGLDYKKNDRNTFGVFYMIQKEWNVSEPQSLYILGLEYTLTL
ncbi:MAG TPA: DUF2490 domain-containing protein [Bacteroidia bacterium]|nr:DUF2490 domain-containing protein [Bacteroidia bacterium]